MKKLPILILVLVVAVFLGATVLQNAVSAGEHMFIGPDKCKMCHKKPDAGEQYPIWEKSRHAQAYASLAGEKALEIAKAKGIANPQEADECLSCHVTGHGAAADLLGTKYDKTQGVTCESCHGAGGDYYKKATMVAIISGETDGASVGLKIPDEKTCLGCHNDKSPTFKEFNYEEMLKKIAHPIPEAKKAEYKKG
jgi:uncharacterized protein YxeA